MPAFLMVVFADYVGRMSGAIICMIWKNKLPTVFPVSSLENIVFQDSVCMDESVQTELSGDAAFIVIRSPPVMFKIYQRLILLRHVCHRRDCG